jgi:hypothetical protein
MKKMKKLPLLFFILLSNFLYSQKEISLDNNISGILNTAQTTQPKQTTQTATTDILEENGTRITEREIFPTMEM